MEDAAQCLLGDTTLLNTIPYRGDMMSKGTIHNNLADCLLITLLTLDLIVFLSLISSSHSSLFGSAVQEDLFKWFGSISYLIPFCTGYMICSIYIHINTRNYHNLVFKNLGIVLVFTSSNSILTLFGIGGTIGKFIDDKLVHLFGSCSSFLILTCALLAGASLLSSFSLYYFMTRLNQPRDFVDLEEESLEPEYKANEFNPINRIRKVPIIYPDHSHELNNDTDDLYNEAVHIVKTQGKASISLMRTQFGIGWNRASKIIQKMTEDGIISDRQKFSTTRRVLMQ